jgi:hypothetical protein
MVHAEDGMIFEECVKIANAAFARRNTTGHLQYVEL